MQRYREVHDIFHAMLLMPTTMLGEVAVKWIEGLQLKLPMCITGAIFGAARLKAKYVYVQIRQTVTVFVSWNLQQFFFGAYLSDTFFLNLYTLYYTRKQLNKRKRVCDTVLGKNSFFLWEFNMGKMDEK